MKRPDTARSFHIKSRLQDLGNSLSGSVLEKRLATYRQLVQAGECKVALENLCEQLFDDDVVVPQQQFKELQALGEELGMEAERWQRLSVADR